MSGPIVTEREVDAESDYAMRRGMTAAAYDGSDGAVTPSRVLSDAAAAVGGARGETHGDWAETHGMAAALWSAYLGAPVGAADVARMMVLLKVARAVCGDGAHPDHDMDAAGYAAIAGALARRGAA